ncbi:MAG: ABC transporter substrate-binding protein [Clostridiales bacterium]|nr:ABC transporter substrate-binding protein [Clostridiales bacterium]
MKKRTAFLALLLVCTMLMLSACGSAGTSGPDAAQNNTLVYASGDYTSINPALYEHGEINSLIFSGLTAHDADNKVVPALAESWEYDEDAYTYTFHLRKDVTWHDGEPFTANDVVFTLTEILDPENQSEIASNYEDIISMVALDDYTFVLGLKAPNVAMLDYLTVGILPQHLLEGKNLITDEFNQKPVGTGPYKLTNWDVGQSITLEKNEDYYGGVPSIDTVIFKIVPDEKTRALQLKSGEVDLAQVTPEDAQQFAGAEGFTTYDMKTADYRGILYNFNNDLFKNNPELTNALSYAIDRQAIIDSVLLGQGEVAYSPLQMGPYNNPDMEKFSYDPEKAQQALEKAGWQKGSDGVYEKNGTRLSFKINCGEGDQVRIDMATICAQQLQAIGVDATVAVNAETDWAGQEAYLIGWGSPFDPDDHTYKVFGTDKGANYSGYSYDKVDELLKKARETDDDAQRKEYYQQFQQALTEKMPFTFIAYVDAIYVGRSNIQGITPDTVLGHHGVGIFWNIADWTLSAS